MTKQELCDFSQKYFHLLNNKYKGLNLTRINDFDSFHQKQIVDSLLPLEQSCTFMQSIKDTKLVLDVGFGGGFPLLPLAFALPMINFLGVEARKKKVDAVETIRDQLNINNGQIKHYRLEEILIDRPVTIVFKAVGKVDDLLSRINVTQGIHCDVYFYKGPNFHNIETISDELLEKWKVIEENFMQLTGNEGRLLIGFSPLKVPRRTRKNKNLVKLSQFT